MGMGIATANFFLDIKTDALLVVLIFDTEDEKVKLCIITMAPDGYKRWQ